MWQRFTFRARKAIYYAQEYAAQRDELYVSTEHLLHGLIHEADSQAARILTHLGVSLSELRDNIEAAPRQDRTAADQDRLLSESSKRVVDLAFTEMRKLKVTFIGPEHLLLGVIAEADGVGAQLLIAHGVDITKVLAIVDHYSATDDSGVWPPPPLVVEPKTAPETKRTRLFDYVIGGMASSVVSLILWTYPFGLLTKHFGSLWVGAVFPITGGIFYGIGTRKESLTLALRVVPPSLFFVLLGVGISLITLLLGLHDYGIITLAGLVATLFLLAAIPSLLIGFFFDWRRKVRLQATVIRSANHG